jgi:hypothetical protein
MLDDKYLIELVKKAAEFGNGKIHIIVNNAGYTWDGVIHKVHQPSSCLFTIARCAKWLTLYAVDHRQAMGHHHCPPQHCTV